MLEKFLLSWYFVVFGLGVVFLIIFKDSISGVIRKIRISNKKFGVSTGEEQEILKDEDLTKLEGYFKENELESFKDFEEFVEGAFNQLSDRTRTLQENQQTISKVLEIAEFYQFMYFNLYLVINSKLALHFFYNCDGCTKEVYLKNFTLSPEIEDPNGEREAIFSTLLSKSLLEEKNSLISVTPRGVKFLKFIGFIK